MDKPNQFFVILATEAAGLIVDEVAMYHAKKEWLFFFTDREHLLHDAEIHEIEMHADERQDSL